MPIIGKLRDAYDDLAFVRSDGMLNLVPSPHYQTKVLQEKGLVKNGQMQFVAGLNVYPATVLCGQTFMGNSLITNRTIAIHHFDGSWVDGKIASQTVVMRGTFKGKL